MGYMAILGRGANEFSVICQIFFLNAINYGKFTGNLWDTWPF